MGGEKKRVEGGRARACGRASERERGRALQGVLERTWLQEKSCEARPALQCCGERRRERARRARRIEEGGEKKRARVWVCGEEGAGRQRCAGKRGQGDKVRPASAMVDRSILSSAMSMMCWHSSRLRKSSTRSTRGAVESVSTVTRRAGWGGCKKSTSTTVMRTSTATQHRSQPRRYGRLDPCAGHDRGC